MNFDEFWKDCTSSEKDLFQKSCRRLLKSTFIVRDKDEENKKAYHFIAKHPEPFSLYFGYIGFDVVVDRDNGVIMLSNCADMAESGRLQSNRMALKKMESIVLCCLWTLYADRIRSGSLSQAIFISVVDLNFELEKYEVKELIDNKKLITDILTLFSRFNLVDIKGKIGDADCMIRLYPSLAFALNAEEFTRFAEVTRKRMLEKGGEDEQDFEELSDGEDEEYSIELSDGEDEEDSIELSDREDEEYSIELSDEEGEEGQDDEADE